MTHGDNWTQALLQASNFLDLCPQFAAVFTRLCLKSLTLHHVSKYLHSDISIVYRLFSLLQVRSIVYFHLIFIVEVLFCVCYFCFSSFIINLLLTVTVYCFEVIPLLEVLEGFLVSFIYTHVVTLYCLLYTFITIRFVITADHCRLV